VDYTSNLILEAEYDDGFIAYINGVEVARCNMGPPQMFVYADQFAFNPGSTSGNPEVIDLGVASALVTAGDNVVAIHVGNRDSGTPMKFEASLRVGATEVLSNGETWSYFGGAIEPSGGVFEPTSTHFRDAGYWPITAPPSYNQNGGDVIPGFQLSMSHSAPGGSVIYYTVDGTDPRDFGGVVSTEAQIYSSPVTLVDAFTVVKARVRNNGGEWSALTESEFKVATVPPTADSLVIAEFLYNPIDPSVAELAAGFTDNDDFEFIQILNIGAQSIDLGEVDFTDGIGFDFGTGAVQAINPGSYVILVKNLDAFRQRYGLDYDALIAGEFSGKLSNGGEQVVLSGPGGTTLRDFTYLDESPWPACADGDGISVVLLNPSSNPDHTLAESWIGSGQFGGLPGGVPRNVNFADWQSYFFDAAELADSLISGPHADPDGDEMSNALEYLLSGIPLKADYNLISPKITVESDSGEDWLTISVRIPQSLSDIQVVAEVTDELGTWISTAADIAEVLPPKVNGDGTITRKFRDQMPLPDGVNRFVRLSVTLP